jgi:hypothetical protein
MDTTQIIFRHLVDFVYKELIKQFLNNNGECVDSTFRLINWSVITDNLNYGIFLKFKFYFFLH